MPYATLCRPSSVTALKCRDSFPQGKPLVDIQHAAGGVREPFRICQPFRPGLADAEDVGGHGQQLPDLLALHRKGKADIFRGQQPEARQRLGHVLFLVSQLIVDDALQPQQVILCGYNLEKQAVILRTR